MFGTKQISAFLKQQLNKANPDATGVRKRILRKRRSIRVRESFIQELKQEEKRHQEEHERLMENKRLEEEEQQRIDNEDQRLAEDPDEHDEEEEECRKQKEKSAISQKSQQETFLRNETVNECDFNGGFYSSTPCVSRDRNLTKHQLTSSFQKAREEFALHDKSGHISQVEQPNEVCVPTDECDILPPPAGFESTDKKSENTLRISDIQHSNNQSGFKVLQDLRIRKVRRSQVNKAANHGDSSDKEDSSDEGFKKPMPMKTRLSNRRYSTASNPFQHKSLKVIDENCPLSNSDREEYESGSEKENSGRRRERTTNSRSRCHSKRHVISSDEEDEEDVPVKNTHFNEKVGKEKNISRQTSIRTRSRVMLSESDDDGTTANLQRNDFAYVNQPTKVETFALDEIVVISSGEEDTVAPLTSEKRAEDVNSTSHTDEHISKNADIKGTGKDLKDKETSINNKSKKSQKRTNSAISGKAASEDAKNNNSVNDVGKKIEEHSLNYDRGRITRNMSKVIDSMMSDSANSRLSTRSTRSRSRDQSNKSKEVSKQKIAFNRQRIIDYSDSNSEDENDTPNDVQQYNKPTRSTRQTNNNHVEKSVSKSTSINKSKSTVKPAIGLEVDASETSDSGVSNVNNSKRCDEIVSKNAFTTNNKTCVQDKSKRISREQSRNVSTTSITNMQVGADEESDSGVSNTTVRDAKNKCIEAAHLSKNLEQSSSVRTKKINSQLNIDLLAQYANEFELDDDVQCSDESVCKSPLKGSKNLEQSSTGQPKRTNSQLNRDLLAQYVNEPELNNDVQCNDKNVSKSTMRESKNLEQSLTGQPKRTNSQLNRDLLAQYANKPELNNDVQCNDKNVSKSTMRGSKNLEQSLTGQPKRTNSQLNRDLLAQYANKPELNNDVQCNDKIVFRSLLERSKNLEEPTTGRPKRTNSQLNRDLLAEYVNEPELDNDVQCNHKNVFKSSLKGSKNLEQSSSVRPKKTNSQLNIDLLAEYANESELNDDVQCNDKPAFKSPLKRSIDVPGQSPKRTRDRRKSLDRSNKESLQASTSRCKTRSHHLKRSNLPELNPKHDKGKKKLVDIIDELIENVQHNSHRVESNDSPMDDAREQSHCENNKMEKPSKNKKDKEESDTSSPSNRCVTLTVDDQLNDEELPPQYENLRETDDAQCMEKPTSKQSLKLVQSSSEKSREESLHDTETIQKANVGGNKSEKRSDLPVQEPKKKGGSKKLKQSNEDVISEKESENVQRTKSKSPRGTRNDTSMEKSSKNTKKGKSYTQRNPKSKKGRSKKPTIENYHWNADRRGEIKYLENLAREDRRTTSSGRIVRNRWLGNYSPLNFGEFKDVALMKNEKPKTRRKAPTTNRNKKQDTHGDDGPSSNLPSTSSDNKTNKKKHVENLQVEEKNKENQGQQMESDDDADSFFRMTNRRSLPKDKSIRELYEKRISDYISSTILNNSRDRSVQIDDAPNIPPEKTSISSSNRCEAPQVQPDKGVVTSSAPSLSINQPTSPEIQYEKSAVVERPGRPDECAPTSTDSAVTSPDVAPHASLDKLSSLIQYLENDGPMPEYLQNVSNDPKWNSLQINSVIPSQQELEKTNFAVLNTVKNKYYHGINGILKIPKCRRPAFTDNAVFFLYIVDSTATIYIEYLETKESRLYVLQPGCSIIVPSESKYWIKNNGASKLTIAFTKITIEK